MLKKIKILYFNLILFLISFSVISVFLYFEYILYFEPCYICRIQQFIYFILFFISLVIFIYPKQFTLFNYVALLFLINLLFSLLQLGIEYDFWSFMGSCHDQLQGVAIKQLETSILNNDSKSCSLFGWHFLGISLSAYNIIISCVFLIFFRLIILKNKFIM